jgi:hypothetical protein
MDAFEKRLVSYDKKNVNERRMDARSNEAKQFLREDTKYVKEYKEKVINLRF